MSNSTSDSKKKIKSLKSGKIARSLDIISMAVQGGQKALWHKVQSEFGVTTQKNALELLKQQVESLTHKLGHLKGGLMKVGQMLSVYGEYFLPPDINQTLKSLQSQSIPFEWDSLKNILEKELGETVLQELEIESTSTASASIGQVHRAVIKKTQESIALKIQYPGVDKAVKTDLLALKSIFKIAELFPNISHLDLLFDEVESMLKQELDYINEMNWTRAYKNKLHENPFFVVPTVYPEFTSSKIIATSFEDGFFVDSNEVKSLSQERRNKIALHVLELYFLELFKWGFVQTDPHIGNYKIRIQNAGTDQIILYDFGAVREFTPEFLENYKGLIRAAYEENTENLKYYAQKLRFIYPEDPLELQSSFFNFCKLMVEPFHTQGTPWHNTQGEYNWTQTDLPKRLTQMVSEVIRNFSVRAPPREVVFLDRKTTGVFIFLSVLRAEIKSDLLLKKYLGI